MKKKLYLLSTILLSAAVLSLSSCLKDNRYIDFAKVGTVVDFPLGGQANFGGDAITDATDTIVRQFAVNVASPNLPTTATTITLAVDNSIVTAYPTTPVAYETMPNGSYVFNDTKVIIPAGKQYATVSVTFYKSKLDPSKSYMLPIKIASSSVGTISGNFGIHYFHFIGNDFAGTYTYDFRRWQNGTGPGTGIIPSKSTAGVPVDITDLGETVIVSPVSATEIQMETEYNGQGVNYDVTFTRTVNQDGSISYTNWSVQFLADDIAKWTAVPIINIVAPKFTIPPPATNKDPKIFEMNYVSGGSATSGRYIDDTYTKQ